MSLIAHCTVYDWPSEVRPARSSCQAEQLQSAAANLWLHLFWMEFPLNSYREQGTTSEGRM